MARPFPSPLPRPPDRQIDRASRRASTLAAGRCTHARWLSVSSNAVLTPLAGQSGAVAPTCVAIKAQNLSAQESALSIDDER